MLVRGLIEMKGHNSFCACEGNYCNSLIRETNSGCRLFRGGTAFKFQSFFLTDVIHGFSKPVQRKF